MKAELDITAIATLCERIHTQNDIWIQKYRAAPVLRTIFIKRTMSMRNALSNCLF
jgi:hypothetical protein